jgi:hypothetical protein
MAFAELNRSRRAARRIRRYPCLVESDVSHGSGLFYFGIPAWDCVFGRRSALSGRHLDIGSGDFVCCLSCLQRWHRPQAPGADRACVAGGKASERSFPEFAKACADDAELVLLHQDAFAADYQEDEYMLLGMAIKYAGLRGKEVRVIGKNRSSLGEEEKIQ